MSAINGDKARFNRKRKQKIHRRKQQQKMFALLSKQTESAASRSVRKP